MSVQIFGTKKCKNTQKALRFFKERGVQVHFVDLTQKKLSAGELRNVSRSVPLEDLIDKECQEYKKKNLAYMSFDLEETLLENPMLLKTPIVRSGQKSTVGHDPDGWKTFVD